MRMVKVLAVLVVMALALWALPPATRANAQGTNWQVQIGAESGDRNIQVLQNYPATITVNLGDTITFTNPTAEIHTVTFLAFDQLRPRFDPEDPLQALPQGPALIDSRVYTNSGLLRDGQSWTATAAQAGTFLYICLVHPQQLGSVNVNPPGSPYPMPQGEYTATARQAEALVADWQARRAAFQPAVRDRPDGTREHTLSAGMGNGIVSAMWFVPASYDIRVGDTVTWVNEDVEAPHTVTFGRPQGPPPLPFGWPQAFDGTEALNSGFIGRGRPQGATFSATFTAPGEFQYVCLLHAGANQTGVIRVTAPGS